MSAGFRSLHYDWVWRTRSNSLKYGVVVENGTHDELMVRNCLYADPHRTQFDVGSDKVVS